MSTIYYLCCTRHKEYVGIAYDSSETRPVQTECPNLVPLFAYQHWGCPVTIENEYSELLEDKSYSEWTPERYDELLDR